MHKDIRHGEDVIPQRERTGNAGALRRLKPYPDYKDSGIEWLGEAPEHWGVKRLKHLATVNDEALPETTDPGMEIDYVDIGNVDPIQGITDVEKLVFADAPSRARRIVRQGDVIISTVRTYLRAIAQIGATDANLIVSTGFAVIRPWQMDDGFVAYAVNAPYFVERVVAHSVGVSYPAINASELVCLGIALPSLTEQRAIAAFLDRETARIDDLVARKERLIELLQEKRTALITQAVTKGLDPDVPMKDSGVEWLGEAPEHWGVKRLKHLATVNDEALPETTDPGMEIDYVDIGNVDPIQGITDVEKLVFADAPSRARRIVRHGDVIISTVRTYLRAIARIEATDASLIVSTGFAVIRPWQMDDEFVAYAVNAPYFVERVVAHSVGVSYPAINTSELVCLDIALPPLPEQRAIAAFLDRETAKIDALVAKIRKAIDLLKEQRTALISAAVTGKIDVRGAAA